MTISGTPVSLEASGTGITIGTSTEAIGVGEWIMSGFGSTPTDIAMFEGSAEQCHTLSTIWTWGIVIKLVAVVTYCLQKFDEQLTRMQSQLLLRVFGDLFIP